MRDRPNAVCAAAAPNASFTGQNAQVRHPTAKAPTVRDLKATGHQTRPVLQRQLGLEDESSTCFGTTQASAAPRGWRRQQRTVLVGGTWEQPSQGVAVTLHSIPLRQTTLPPAQTCLRPPYTPHQRKEGCSTSAACLRPSEQLRSPLELGILPLQHICH